MSKFLSYLASGLLLTSCASDPIPDPALEKGFWLNSISSCTCENKTEFQAHATRTFEDGTIALSPRDTELNPAENYISTTVNGAIINNENDTIARLIHVEIASFADQIDGTTQGVIRSAYFIGLANDNVHDVYGFSSYSSAYYTAGRREKISTTMSVRSTNQGILP